MKVYVKSTAQISALNPDPDYSKMFSMMEARRMTRLMKRAVAVTDKALLDAGVEMPDAVITGTGLGCIVNTEQFLSALKSDGALPLKPTHFMQSTHNTISSLISIRRKCHGYNATYSHSSVSFESAVLDAYIQMTLESVSNALVSEFDEITADLSDCFSETAASVVLAADSRNALCELADVRLSCSPIKVPDADVVITREDCIAKYGNNPGVSALGFCDAVELVSSGKAASAAVSNNSDKYNSLIVLCKVQ